MSKRLITLMIMCVLAACGGDTSVDPNSVAPRAPENPLTAARTAEIVFSWKDVSDNETGFHVEYHDANTTQWTVFADLPANTTSITHSDVTHNLQYFYRVQACNAVGCSAFAEAAGKWQGNTVPTVNNVTVNAVMATSANLVAAGFDGGLPVNVIFILRKASETQPFFRSNAVSGFTTTTVPTDRGLTYAASMAYFSLAPDTEYVLSAEASNALGPALENFSITFRTRTQ
jgi:hypothetical protein